MQEIYGDLFESVKADAIGILTNGFVSTHGAATMGRGCAAKAKFLWPGIQVLLGDYIRLKGNQVHLLTKDTPEGGIQLPQVAGWGPHLVPYHIFSFPTKNHWKDPSIPELIVKSAQELIAITTWCQWKSVVLPRPGCGLGNLSWTDQVQPLLAPLLDDRFYIIHFEKE